MSEIREFDKFIQLTQSKHEPTFEGMKIVFIKKVIEFSQDVLRFEKCSKTLREYKEKHNDLDIGSLNLEEENLNEIEELKDFKKTIESYKEFESIFNIFNKIGKSKINNIKTILGEPNETKEHTLDDDIRKLIRDEEILEDLGIENNGRIADEELVVMVVNELISKYRLIIGKNLISNLVKKLQNDSNKKSSDVWKQFPEIIEKNKENLQNIVNIIDGINSIKEIIKKLESVNSLKEIFASNEHLLNTEQLTDEEIIENFNQILKIISEKYNFKCNNISEFIDELNNIAKDYNFKELKKSGKGKQKEQINQQQITPKEQVNQRLKDLSKRSESLNKLKLQLPSVTFIDCGSNEFIEDEKHLSNMEIGERRWFIVSLGGHYCAIAVEKTKEEKFNSFAFDANSTVPRNECF